MPYPIASVYHLTSGLAEPAGFWEGKASLNLHTLPDPHGPVPGHTDSVEKPRLAGKGSPQVAHGPAVSGS